ncbi:hypothetical protein, partial [Pandoraea sp.]|uniref:hypothetical protein n=1 Tax=Pandoraea sp. TaxID=1883445 RepID=UPI0025DE2BD6
SPALAMLCDPAIYPPMTFPCVVRLSTALKTPRFSAMNLFFAVRWRVCRAQSSQTDDLTLE